MVALLLRSRLSDQKQTTLPLWRSSLPQSVPDVTGWTLSLLILKYTQVSLSGPRNLPQMLYFRKYWDVCPLHLLYLRTKEARTCCITSCNTARFIILNGRGFETYKKPAQWTAMIAHLISWSLHVMRDHRNLVNLQFFAFVYLEAITVRPGCGSCSATVRPIGIDAVAAGEGALHIWMLRSP